MVGVISHYTNNLAGPGLSNEIALYKSSIGLRWRSALNAGMLGSRGAVAPAQTWTGEDARRSTGLGRFGWKLSRAAGSLIR